ncbi:MAG: hypothetical protein IJ400_00835 [Clostridia bacterium]|nr:hypothetical protein [Clostridia bacterium]
MPSFIYVIIGLVLLVAIILALKVKLVLAYEGEFSAYLQVLCFKFPLFKDEEKKKKKKKAKKKKTANNQAPQGQGEKKEEKPQKKKEPSVLSKLIKFRSIVFDILECTLGRLHFKFAKLNILVGTDNASTTALAYSAVCSGVACLIALLDEVSNVDISRFSEINIQANFLSEESIFEGKVILYCRVLPLLTILTKIIKLIYKIKLNEEDLEDGTI